MTVPILLKYGDALLLDRYEQDFGRRIGDLRNKLSQDRKCVPCGAQDYYAILSNNRAGAMAELAVARKLNIYPNLDFDHYLAYNLRLPNGDRIQVQWNGMNEECLQDVLREANHVAKERELPDFHIVLVGKPFEPEPKDARNGSLKFVGWATHAEVLAAPKEQRTEQNRDTHVLKTLHQNLEVHPYGERGTGFRDPAPPEAEGS